MESIPAHTLIVVRRKLKETSSGLEEKNRQHSLSVISSHAPLQMIKKSLFKVIPACGCKIKI
jgi:hypothetical protein